MFYKDQNISINKQIVAKVFKYQKKKFSGIKFFTPSKYNMQVGLMFKKKIEIFKVKQSPFTGDQDKLKLKKL